MNTTEMRVLSSIVEQTKLNRVPNEEIRSMCDIQLVDQWTNRRIDEWNAHVKRMTPNRLVRRARYGVYERKKKSLETKKEMG
ncbi:hypothetical protein C0J52_23445 [Blattella germanica]|nr:hypothetical protein C0J52_23445 [Blattella germanica]